MKIDDIRSIAKTHSITTGKLSKTELIKSIQINEGNFDCFATAHGGECDQGACSWRDDCSTAARTVKP
jgi:hypothetical protein